MCSQGFQKVSKQAIDKRFNETTKELLYKILNKVIDGQLTHTCVPALKDEVFTDIQVMDSTEFLTSKRSKTRFPGYGGTGRESIVQVQFEYQILSKRVTHFSIGSALDSDFKAGMETLDNISAKTLLLRDLAYVGYEYFKELNQRGIYYISRAKSQWNFYIRKDDQYHLLSTSDIIFLLNNQKGKYIDIDVFVGRGTVKTPLRLIANLLTNEQKKQRFKKKSENRKLGKDALEGIGLNLFVSNLPKEKYSPDKVYQLYRLRWQIELMFKTWKSVMKFSQIHPMNGLRLECIILVKLIWVMLNWGILKLLEKTSDLDISFYKLCQSLNNPVFVLQASIINNRKALNKWLYLISFFVNEHKKEYKITTCKSIE